MFKNLKSKNKGQAIFTQYSLLILMVLSFVMIMTTFVKRALQSRYLSARDLMFSTANAVYSNTALRLQGNLMDEYEPYYLYRISEQNVDNVDVRRLLPGGAGGIHHRDYDDRRGIKAFSNTLPGNFYVE